MAAFQTTHSRPRSSEAEGLLKLPYKVRTSRVRISKAWAEHSQRNNTWGLLMEAT